MRYGLGATSIEKGMKKNCYLKWFEHLKRHGTGEHIVGLRECIDPTIDY